MSIRNTITALFLAMSILCSAEKRSAELDSLFGELDRVLLEKDKIDRERLDLIDSMRDSLRRGYASTPQQKFKLYDHLYNAYFAFSCDSTNAYLERKMDIAHELGDDAMLNRLMVLQARNYASLGIFHVAMKIIWDVDPSKLDKDGLREFYEASAYIFANMSVHSMNDRFKKYIEAQCWQYVDSVFKYYEPDSKVFLAYSENVARLSGDVQKALEINDKRLSMTDMTQPDYAKVAFDRSMLYEIVGDNDNRMKYLLLSAISDIMSSTKDTASLSLLAGILYEEGNVKDAHRYMAEVMDDVEYYNSPLRRHQNANLYRMIEKTNELSTKAERRNFILVICLFIALLAAAVGFIVYAQIQRRRRTILIGELRGANDKLTLFQSKLIASNNTKEQYMTLFLTLCSKHIDKLANYRQTVYRKLANRQYDELMRNAKDTDFTREESDEFFDSFDTAFCMMYPHFIEEYNNLLSPEYRVEIGADGKLTPQLRIFALIRLGINNPAEISRLLHYSLSTIYNYRVKVHKQAIVDSRTFEERIMAIDSLDDELGRSESEPESPQPEK